MEVRIQDPIELIELHQEEVASQCTLPNGKWQCPNCKKPCGVDDLIALTPAPDSPLVCYDCLPTDVRIRYDEFEKTMTNPGEGTPADHASPSP